METIDVRGLFQKGMVRSGPVVPRAAIWSAGLGELGNRRVLAQHEVVVHSTRQLHKPMQGPQTVLRINVWTFLVKGGLLGLRREHV